MKKLITLCGLLVFASSLFAQQATLVQNSASELRACSTLNATAAVNATVTLTITPPAGQYVYLCGLDISISNDATGAVVSTNLSFTSTNLGGWAWKFSAANAANTSLTQSFNFNFPVKSAAAGTAVTIVSPAANTHAAYNINGYYYFAP